MSDGQLVLAYHGCDVSTRDRLVRGTLPHLAPSANRYDWLGGGVYFFEGDAERALSFAKSASMQPARHLSARPVVSPSVVGAVLCVSRWWDMTTVEGRRSYLNALGDLREAQAMLNRPMPMNEAAALDDETVLLRRLDCAVFNMGHLIRERQGRPAFQAIRAAFYQGRPVTDTSEFRTGTHLQIALRDPGCVKGWFLPPALGSVLLDEGELARADRLMEEATRSRQLQKPRVRVKS